ncbi:unnamed protein product [Nesidiocoris tenuis]|uniref:EGF-like domain-containing protein n=1 Tax=Nesidiocoris tenuis TaxID=355587 RepID=A0A6H5GQB5_9HEMI|nr:unnamed protein product [Nesidiocoris tenuis]
MIPLCRPRSVLGRRIRRFLRLPQAKANCEPRVVRPRQSSPKCRRKRSSSFSCCTDATSVSPSSTRGKCRWGKCLWTTRWVKCPWDRSRWATGRCSRWAKCRLNWTASAGGSKTRTNFGARNPSSWNRSEVKSRWVKSRWVRSRWVKKLNLRMSINANEDFKIAGISSFSAPKSGYGSKYPGRRGYSKTSWQSKSAYGSGPKPLKYTGYGHHLTKAVCLPGCENGGACVSPNLCSCPSNFYGPYCQYERKPCRSPPALPNNSRRTSASACDVRSLSFNGNYKCNSNSNKESLECVLRCPDGMKMAGKSAAASTESSVHVCSYANGTFYPPVAPRCVFASEKLKIFDGQKFYSAPQKFAFEKVEMGPKSMIFSTDSKLKIQWDLQLINPEEFLETCKWDYCACEIGGLLDHDCGCKSIEMYVKECRDHGVEVSDWRSPSFCRK